MPDLMQKILSDDELHRTLLENLLTLRKKITTFREESNLDKRFTEWYQLYKSYPDIYRTKEKWEANIFIPLIYQFVSTIHPRITNAVYSVFPLYELSGETPRAYHRADKSAAILNSMLYQNDFYQNLNDATLFSLIFGTSILKYVVQRHGFTRVFPEYCDPATVGVDPNASDFDNARYVYHDVWKPLYHLLAMEKDNVYHGIQRIIDDHEGGMNEQTPANRRLASINMAPESFTTDEYRVTEYYAIIENPFVANEYNDMLFTVVNDKYIVRAEENPYGIFPFEREVLMPVPGEFYGISVPQVLQHLQYEANEKRNQILDANRLVVNPIWMVVHNSILGAYKNRDIDCEPGTTIDVVDTASIAPLQFNLQALLAGYQDLQVTREDMKDAMGLFDYNRGAPRAGDQTATEIVSLINEGNMRFLMMIMNLEHHTLRRLGRNVLLLLKNNMLVSESVKVTRLGQREGLLVKEDMGFQSLKRSDIEYDYEFRCMASSAYNMRAIDRQYILQLSDMLSKDPNMVGQYDNIALYKMLARSMNIRDLGFFNPPGVQEENLPDNIAPEMMAGLLGKGAGAMQGQAPTPSPGSAPGMRMAVA